MRFHSLAVVAAFLLCAGLSAQSPLSTIFASNNGGSAGGAVYFDLIGGNTGVEVNAFDLNYDSAGAAAGVEVYVRPGTFLGNETANDWTKVAQDDGTAISAGDDNPTNVVLNQSFCIPAGATIGIALVAPSTVGHEYTNGNGSPCTNCTYSTNELTLTAGSATNSPFTGLIFNPRVVNCNVYYTLSSGCNLLLPPALEAVSEATQGSGTLSQNSGASFQDGSFLRWNYVDTGNNFTGNPAATVLNIGVGGSPAVGSTSQIPGFEQLWAGSTPSGTAYVFGPSFVGAPDFTLPIPAGIFNPGDVVRIQGLVIDPSAGGVGLFPVRPTLNTIEFVHTDCIDRANFDGLSSGPGNYPSGWSNGGGTHEWEVDSGGTSSFNTGPSSAVSAPNYMYCETSSPATTGDTWIMNTATYSSANFSRNTLDFQLSRLGSAIGTLEVRMDDGTGAFATVLATYTGPEPSGIEWTAESIALPTPLPANVQFQFHYTYGGSFTGDIAIDDFCVK